MIDIGRLNYAALEAGAKVRKSDFTPAEWKEFRKSQRNTQMKAGCIASSIGSGVIALLVIAAVIASRSPSGQSGEDIATIIIATLILCVPLNFLWISYFRGQKQQPKIYRFARDNGLQFTDYVSSDMLPQGPMMFAFGAGRSARNVMWYRDQFLMGRYIYSSENDKSLIVDFARIQLSRRLPHLYLDGRRNKVGTHPERYDAQKLKLEGDFSQYFTVYAPPHYQVDALQILTPDVMAKLRDFGTNFDFEIVDNYLYIYAPKYTLSDVDKMRAMLTCLKEVADEFDHQAKKYTDARAGNPTIGAAPAAVAESGARIKKKVNRHVWFAAAFGACAILCCAALVATAITKNLIFLGAAGVLFLGFFFLLVMGNGGRRDD